MTKQNAGFTLIDLAVLLTICGILMLPVLKQVNIHYINIRNGNTDANERTAAVAIQQYYLLTGAYPCPADITLPETDPNYGRAVPCNAAGDPDPAIGAVPFQDIKIQADAALDGYKNRLVYVVSKDLTSSATFINGGSLEFHRLFLDTSTGTLVDNVTNDGHFGLLSYGLDGMGTYTADAVKLATCAGTSLEVENCDGDNIFLHHDYRTSDVAGTNYFDDRVYFVNTIGLKVWKTADLNPSDIFSPESVFIGVGTSTPEFPLDVAGNIRTQGGDAQSNDICESDISSPNCFVSDMIAGAGTGCSDPEAGMSGIKKGAADCTLRASGIAGTCPTGKFVTGITSGGALICGP